MPSETIQRDPLDRPLYGAAAIAEEANLPGDGQQKKAKAFYMLEKKYLDGTKVGAIWTSTPRRIRKSLGIETS
jgi:hypothetical protein